MTRGVQAANAGCGTASHLIRRIGRGGSFKTRIGTNPQYGTGSGIGSIRRRSANKGVGDRVGKCLSAPASTRAARRTKADITADITRPARGLATKLGGSILRGLCRSMVSRDILVRHVCRGWRVRQPSKRLAAHRRVGNGRGLKARGRLPALT